jgi:hypothetical protein
MMRVIRACLALTCLWAFSSTVSARSWIIENYQLQDGPFYEVVGGGYNGANYYYSTGKGIQRCFWQFDFPDVSSRPAMYFVEQWAPSIMPAGVTGWDWLPIEVNFSSKDVEPWPNNNSIPWSGQYGSNHQWIGIDLPNELGAFQSTGPGPQAPADASCSAPGNGLFMWIRKGSWLYTKWDFDFGNNMTHPVTALRITELNPPSAPVCDAATLGGPIDFRCVGNADPLYAGSEYYGNGADASVDGNSLGADGYVAPTCFTSNSPLDFGLPPSGLYTAHLPGGDLDFQLRFDGNNSLKWRDDDLGIYARSNIYTLNDVAGQEFVEGRYARLHLLSVKGGGSNGTLQMEAVYSDDSVEAVEVNLYDWFNQDGDSGSVAVGVDGSPRSAGESVIGFKRLGSDGAPDGGGDHSGAFLFVHSISLNKSKLLKQIRLSIGDQGAFDGELCVLAATLEVGCNDPVFDVGGGPVGEPLEPDGAVDQLDFAFFQACFTGVGDPQNLFDRSRCGCFDINGDQDIDSDDYAGFVLCSSGPGILADPACDD